MTAVFDQVLILFCFIAAGYTLCRLGIIKSEHAKILSGLLVYVFSPCNSFSTFSNNFTPAYITDNYHLLTASVVTIILLAVPMHFIAKLFTKNEYDRGVYEYSLVLANYGYMGYTLANGLLGEIGMLNLMVFCIPALIYTYTYGYCRLTKSGLSPKKLLNPVVIGILLGMAVGLFGIELPTVVKTVSSMASSCMGPVSMLLAGIVVSEFDVKRLIVNPRTYIMTALRLVVIPLIIGCILKLIGANAAITASVMIFVSMPCGLNTIVFPKMVDENCEIGASLALTSNVFACFTVPVVLTLFGVGA